jgi:hypothetical protein
MPTPAEQLIGMATNLGGMLRPDAPELPSGVSRKDLRDFLQSVITQHRASAEVQKANLGKVLHDIDAYFEEVISKKNKLIEEENAEAALNFLAGAGNAFSAVLSAFPGLSFAISAVTAAEMVAAMAIEVEAHKLQNTIVEDLSNANGNLSQHASLKVAFDYATALTKNQAFYPRLRLAEPFSFIDAFFQGSVIALEAVNKRPCTVDDLVDFYVQVLNASRADVGKIPLVNQLSDLLSKLDGADEVKVKELVKSAVEASSDGAAYIATAITTAVAAALAIKSGRNYLKTYGQVRAATSPTNDYVNVDEDMATVEESGSKITAWKVTAGVAMSVAAAVALGVQIGQIKAADRHLSKAIAQSRLSLCHYYTVVIGGARRGDVGFSFAQKESVAHLLDKEIALSPAGHPTEHLEIEDDSKNDGAALQLWEREPKKEKNIRWILKHSGSDSDGTDMFSLYNPALEKYLHVDTQKNDDEVRTSSEVFSFYISHKKGHPCQLWSEKGLVICNEPGNTGNGAKLMVCPWNGKTDEHEQHWLLKAVG